MHFRNLLLYATVLLVACSGCSRPPAQFEITGTASYRERMLLPPDSTLEVTLEDVSRADAPAWVTRIRIPVSTAPPFKFRLPVTLRRIKTKRRYVVRASIIGGGEAPVSFRHRQRRVGARPISCTPTSRCAARARTWRPKSPAHQLRGMYSYMADAGWFVDCLSGVRLAVAQEGDNAALEAAYSKSRSMGGVPLLATVEGRVEDRMPMEGPGPRPTLIVEKFISVEPDQGCSGPASTAQLENTYWKLMTLEGKSIETPAGAREIHFVLNRESFRIQGFAGCNRLTGSYQLNFDKIKFSQMAGTMMACTGGMDIERQTP